MPTQTRETDRRVTGRSPANIMKHLAGVSFPASKGDLLRTARENDAPSEVMDELEQLPSSSFGGPQDVLKAFGQER